MLAYQVLIQQQDNTFEEIAKTTFLVDAETILNRIPAGMIVHQGSIIVTKSLQPSTQSSLF